jgi:hypothetical protein
MQNCMAHGAENEAAYLTPAAGSDDEQPRVLRLLDEHQGGMAARGLLDDLDRGVSVRPTVESNLMRSSACRRDAASDAHARAASLAGE